MTRSRSPAAICLHHRPRGKGAEGRSRGGVGDQARQGEGGPHTVTRHLQELSASCLPAVGQPAATRKLGSGCLSALA